MSSIADIRKDYRQKTLSENEIAADPYEQFGRWWQEALDCQIDEVNAMTLSTVSASGKPASRIVLLKGYDTNGFVFFTNYLSHKGKEIVAHPEVSLLFFWKELERQVRIDGRAEKISAEENDAYFDSRPEESKIGAWSSAQSEVIAGRNVLEEKIEKYKAQFAGKKIPRPQHWGGYLISPVEIEFWQGRPGRLHDRLRYSRSGANWKIDRLSP